MKANELKQILQNNQDIMAILTIIDTLDLKDAWLCAGAIRNFIWNYLMGINSLDFSTDIDLIYYDKTKTSEETFLIEKRLIKDYPKYKWSVKNQVYMHTHNPNTQPYENTCDAIAKFPERCTAVAVRLKNCHEEIELLAPYGMEDIVNFWVRPTPHYLMDDKRRAVYNERVKNKDWQSKWPDLKIFIV